MGRDELVLALKRKGEAEAKTLWQQAENELDRYRQQKLREIDQRQESCAREAGNKADFRCRQVGWKSEKLERRIRLQTLHDLENRLKRIAAEALQQIPAAQRRQILARTVAELPAAPWQTVSTHPDDGRQLQKLFANAQLQADAAISGGLVAETDGGDVRVDNTLCTRLKRCWPELSGRMLAELEAADDA